MKNMLKIKLKNKTKTTEDLFIENINQLFTESHKSLNQLKTNFETITSDSSETRTIILSTEKQLFELQSKLFHQCCSAPSRELFDKYFAQYRDFLLEYNQLTKTIDNFCTEWFKETKHITSQIIEIKEHLLLVTNDNIAEHNTIHFHNEPYLQKIEKLIAQRKILLQQTIA